MKSKTANSFIAAMAAMVIIAAGVNATTHCVRPGGAEGCFATIGEALSACSAGDTVVVYPGDYWESVVINTAGVVLMAEGEPCAVKILPPDGDAVRFELGADSAIIQGFYIEAIAGSGIFSNRSLSFQIRNCVITRCLQRGIYITNAGVKTVLNCVIYDNTGTGIECNSNYLYVKNSVIARNNAWGIDETGDASGVVITAEYNNVYDNNSGNYHGNIIHTLDISEDPQFDPESCWHLQPSSPGIDTGDPGMASLDCDGTRNDIGIYGGRYAYCGPGPVVTSLQLIPATVVKGETFRIEAVGAAR